MGGARVPVMLDLGVHGKWYLDPNLTYEDVEAAIVDALRNDMFVRFDLQRDTHGEGRVILNADGLAALAIVKL